MGLALSVAPPQGPAGGPREPGSLLGPDAAKVDARVWAAAEAGAGFLVRLDPPPGAEAAAGATAGRMGVVAALRRRGARRMAAVAAAVADLRRSGHVEASTVFPVAGAAAVVGDAEAVRTLARVPGVAEIRPDAVRHLPWGEDVAPRPGPGAPSALPQGMPSTGLPGSATWNVAALGAPRVWERLGVAGEGVVVAIIDTGVEWTHPALQAAYRGRRGDHDYNWIDLTTVAAGQPTDPFGHGTHVAGLVVGHDDQTTYGVAPGAQWIAARVFDATGASRDSWLLAAGEWVLAPTDRSGRNPRPGAAPDVVNASWVLDNGADPLYRPLVAAWRAAGIVPVFAAGNDDRGLGTYAGILAPASYPEALGVGALGVDGRVWYRSLGGPSFYGGVAPALVAPGVDTVSTEAQGGSGRRSGTSMAAPHVAATAALMLSARPDLRPADVARLLGATAADIPPPGPDDPSGYGAVDAYAATEEALMAGRVVGTVAAQGSVVSGATVRAASGRRSWVVTTDDRGAFDVAAAAGEWRLEGEAFGWQTSRRRVTVTPGIASRVDLELRPRPEWPVRGEVTSELGHALVGALVGVTGSSAGDHRVTTGPGGAYRLDLPEGLHVLRAEAGSRRAVTATVVVPNPGAGPDFVLPQAPRLLVVDADAVLDERIYPYLTRGLEAAGFPVSVWVPGDLAAVPAPRLVDVLAGYDVVLWSHRALSPGLLDRRRGDTAVTDALTQWVASGGRLVLSGQDVGRYDSAEGAAPNRAAPGFYRQVLAARWVADWTARPRVVGRGAFGGLDLALDAPRGYRRGPRLSPDVVATAPGTGGASLALVYPPLGGGPEGGAAVAAAGPEGRRLYMAFGPEGAGSDVARSALLARAVEWVAPPDIVVTAPGRLQAGEVGRVRIGVWGAAFSQPAAVTVTLPAALEAVEPFTGGLARRDAGRLAWSGQLAPRRVRELSLGVRFGRPYPGGRALDVVARLLAAGRLRSSRAALTLAAPDLSPSVAWASPLRVPGGGRVSLGVALANKGPEAAAAAADLQVAVGLDADAGSLAVTRGQAEWVAPGRARWQGEIAPDGGVTITLTATPRGPGTLAAALRAVIDDGAGVVVTRSAAVIVGGPDLTVSRLTVFPGEIAPGRPATATLVVSNTGAGRAEARARLALPAGLEILGAGAHEWRGSVPPGAVATATWPLMAAADGPRGRQMVTATLDDGLVPPRPVVRSAAVDVRRPDLSRSRAMLLPPRAASGTAVTSTVLVGNGGDATAVVEARVALPPALVLDADSAVVSAGTVVPETAGLTWRLVAAPEGAARRWRTEGTAAERPPPTEPLVRGVGDGGPVPLGLAFPLAGEVYTRAWITTDGLVAFGDPQAAGTPSARGPGVPALAPLWKPRPAQPPPRVARGDDEVWIRWPGPAGEVWARLGWRGDFTFGYGPRVESAGGWVGWRGADAGVAGPGWGGAIPGGGVDVEPPVDWEVLRFRAVVSRALGPNSPVTHTVGVSRAGRSSTLVAGLVANRLSLEATRLVASPAMRTPGALVTYTLSLRADGDVEARGVEAEIRLPPGVALAADPEDLAVDAGGGTLRWRGVLAPGAEGHLRWQGRLSSALAPGSRAVTVAVVRAHGLDPVVRLLGQRVTTADFSGSVKGVSPAVAAPGRILGFTLRAVNAGSGATTVEVTDALPPGLELVPTSPRASSGPPPEWDPASASLRWRGELGPRQAVEIRFQATMTTSAGVRNVMHLSDGAGSAYAAWADVYPARARVFLPRLVSHGP